MGESKLANVKQSLEDSLKNQHCGFIDGVGDVYAVSEETIKDALELLKEQAATIKAQQLRWYPELIRCCDCIYCVKEPNGELYCDILAVGYEPLGSKKVNADWFCADGERKDS